MKPLFCDFRFCLPKNRRGTSPRNPFFSLPWKPVFFKGLGSRALKLGTDCSGAEVWVFAPGFFATGEPSENGDKRNFVPEKKTMEPENVGFGRCFFFFFFDFFRFSPAPFFKGTMVCPQGHHWWAGGCLRFGGFSHIEMGFTTWNDSRNPCFVVQLVKCWLPRKESFLTLWKPKL